MLISVLILLAACSVHAAEDFYKSQPCYKQLLKVVHARDDVARLFNNSGSVYQTMCSTPGFENMLFLHPFFIPILYTESDLDDYIKNCFGPFSRQLNNIQIQKLMFDLYYAGNLTSTFNMSGTDYLEMYMRMCGVGDARLLEHAGNSGHLTTMLMQRGPVFNLIFNYPHFFDTLITIDGAITMLFKYPRLQSLIYSMRKYDVIFFMYHLNEIHTILKRSPDDSTFPPDSNSVELMFNNDDAFWLFRNNPRMFAVMADHKSIVDTLRKNRTIIRVLNDNHDIIKMVFDIIDEESKPEWL